MSSKASLSCKLVGTHPVIATTGLPAKLACANAGIVFTIPGPIATIATPGVRVTRPQPSAMFPAACSCLTSMTLTPSSRSVSQIGNISLLAKVKTCDTPSAIKAFATMFPPFTSDIFRHHWSRSSWTVKIHFRSLSLRECKG